MLPGLMSLGFCCSIWMVGLESGINNMRAWLHQWYQWFQLLVV